MVWNKNLFSPSSRVCKSKMNMLTRLVPSKGIKESLFQTSLLASGCLLSTFSIPWFVDTSSWTFSDGNFLMSLSLHITFFFLYTFIWKPAIFEIASKYCISDSFVDYDGYSISSKVFLPTVGDVMVIWVKFTHSSHFSSLRPPTSHSQFVLMTLPFCPCSWCGFLFRGIFKCVTSFCSQCLVQGQNLICTQ